MKFYMVYLGGSYIAAEIEAPTKEAAYNIIGDKAEEFQLMSPAEYDHWFGDDE